MMNVLRTAMTRQVSDLAKDLFFVANRYPLFTYPKNMLPTIKNDINMIIVVMSA
jgi:hypothetical protein